MEQFSSAQEPYGCNRSSSSSSRRAKSRHPQIIYMARNPKDVLVSYYHFHHCAAMLETPKDFSDFFEKFLDGRVYGNTWFEHIKTYYSHRDDMKILYVTYEDMIQRAHRQPDADMVEHAKFHNMMQNPCTNYRQIPDTVINHKRGSFMRKGTIGVWKNLFSVAQSERFDKVFQEKMRASPFHLNETCPRSCQK
ncbi:sulfotransferase 1C3-like [Alosa alosa]|uniref:sulfotransferase 1C3-like n=1 Tax=Alosa alosa TaxID=278164 RepID=UPI0020153B5E|nr:sulfotransferase 1C3-like [Alosa alosa]